MKTFLCLLAVLACVILAIVLSPVSARADYYDEFAGSFRSERYSRGFGGYGHGYGPGYGGYGPYRPAYGGYSHRGVRIGVAPNGRLYGSVSLDSLRIRERTPKRYCEQHRGEFEPRHWDSHYHPAPAPAPTTGPLLTGRYCTSCRGYYPDTHWPQGLSAPCAPIPGRDGPPPPIVRPH